MGLSTCFEKVFERDGYALLRVIEGRGDASEIAEVSSGAGTVVFQTRKSTLKAQRHTLAYLHLSAQTDRGNNTETICSGGDCYMQIILRNCKAVTDPAWSVRCEMGSSTIAVFEARIYASAIIATCSQLV